jgi:hypothetical protein
MYGLVDLEIVKEITRLMRRDNNQQQASEVEPTIAHPIETAREKPAPIILVDCGQHQAAAEC